MERKLTVLLVEDDPKACEDIVAYVDSLDDVALLNITNIAAEAVQAVHSFLPDVVILDLELHHGSGSGLSFLQNIQKNPPRKVPYILITTNNSSTMTYEAVRQFGADYIFSKHQEDYSAKTVIDFLRMLKNVIHSHHVEKGSGAVAEETPVQKNKRLIHRICAELDQVGISPKTIGRRYLIDGIQIVIQAPTQNLCNIIGQKYGKTASSVERAMQNAIARAWRTTPIDDLLTFYTAKINSEKGVPTVTEFIYYYVNKIKDEY